MAHKKAAAANASQKGNRQGKHRGIKKSDGQFVSAGTILVTQVGSVYSAGENVSTGRDFTLFALTDGYVKFTTYTKDKKRVNVVTTED